MTPRHALGESTGTGTGPTPTPTTITVSPTPTSIASPTPTSVVSPTPTPVSTSAFSWEAEDGVVSGFTKATNANNVTYIYQPTSVSTPSQGGKAVYNFTLASPGTYVVRIVVNAPNVDANSLYVNVDSEPSDPTMISDITQLTGTTTFEARTLSWRGNGTFDNNQYVPEVFSLSAGTHQLIVRGREAKVLLDRISVEPY